MSMPAYATELHLIAMANAVLCAICGFVCICRLNVMQRSVRPVRWLVVAEYAVGVGAMIFSALRPLIGEWPGYASIVVNAYIALALLASGRGWRDARGEERPPQSATQPADLHATPDR